MKLGLLQIAVHCEMATRKVSGKFSIWLQILIFYLDRAALPVFVQRYPFVRHKNLLQYKGLCRACDYMWAFPCDVDPTTNYLQFPCNTILFQLKV